MATFDAKFSNLAQNSEAVPVTPGGRGLGAGATPSSSQVSQQDFTLVGAWEELWECHLHERESDTLFPLGLASVCVCVVRERELQL